MLAPFSFPLEPLTDFASQFSCLQSDASAFSKSKTELSSNANVLVHYRGCPLNFAKSGLLALSGGAMGRFRAGELLFFLEQPGRVQARHMGTRAAARLWARRRRPSREETARGPGYCERRACDRRAGERRAATPTSLRLAYIGPCALAS